MAFYNGPSQIAMAMSIGGAIGGVVTMTPFGYIFPQLGPDVHGAAFSLIVPLVGWKVYNPNTKLTLLIKQGYTDNPTATASLVAGGYLGSRVVTQMLRM